MYSQLFVLVDDLDTVSFDDYSLQVQLVSSEVHHHLPGLGDVEEPVARVVPCDEALD